MLPPPLIQCATLMSLCHGQDASVARGTRRWRTTLSLMRFDPGGKHDQHTHDPRDRARCVNVPGKRAPISASGALPDMALVLVDLDMEEGLTGRSYLFAFAPWTFRPIVRCLDALAEMLKRDRVVPFVIAAKLRQRLTLPDPPGLVGLALSAIDMCAWDVLAQGAGLPLARFLGGELSRSVRITAAASGSDLSRQRKITALIVARVPLAEGQARA